MPLQVHYSICTGLVTLAKEYAPVSWYYAPHSPHCGLPGVLCPL